MFSIHGRCLHLRSRLTPSQDGSIRSHSSRSVLVCILGNAGKFAVETIDICQSRSNAFYLTIIVFWKYKLKKLSITGNDEPASAVLWWPPTSTFPYSPLIGRNFIAIRKPNQTDSFSKYHVFYGNRDRHDFTHYSFRIMRSGCEFFCKSNYRTNPNKKKE